MKSYLSKRSQCVSIDSKMSQKQTKISSTRINYGPAIIFNIYNLPLFLSENVLSFYADDTTIYDIQSDF